MTLNKFYVDEVIKNAIKEDINYVDVSADYLIPENQRNDSYFIAKDDGILCGLDVAMRVFELLDDTFAFTAYKKDGDEVKKGDIITDRLSNAIVSGSRQAVVFRGKQPDLVRLLLIGADHRFAPIGRAVIHHDDLIVVRKPDGQQGIQRFGNVIFQIVYRYND